MSRNALNHVAAGVTVLALTGCGAGRQNPAVHRPRPRHRPRQRRPRSRPIRTTPPSRGARTWRRPRSGARHSRPHSTRQLREAAWADDVDRAAELVTRGADVNAKDDTQQSAYLIATSEGYVELLELTLAHGAAVNDKDSWNGTGLIRAAERGHSLVVGRLLQEGIDRDHVNRIGYQALHEAVWLGAGHHRLRRHRAGPGRRRRRADPPVGQRGPDAARDGGAAAATRRSERCSAVLSTRPEIARPNSRTAPRSRARRRRPGRACPPGRRGHRDPRRTPNTRPCCSRSPMTTSTSPGCSSPWVPTPTPWTTSTTHRGWSRASPAACRCSRRCSPRDPTWASSTGTAAPRSSPPASAVTSTTCVGC